MPQIFKPLLLMTVALTTMAVQSASLKHTATVEGVKSYELDNGLQVLLFPDASKPTATVTTTYLVGSRMENYGETGMAHLLEHLMFKGSKNYPDPTKEFTRRGFRMNGTTWLDRTNYYVSFTPTDDNMRWALGWHADAMVNSFIAKKDLDTEMTVVRNEYEMGENNPTSVMLKRMQSVLFDWHAYGHNTIGARSDIENVPIENLQAFYRKWYQPDNAVVTVTGKFDEEKVLNWIGETFGQIERPTRVLPTEWTTEPVADGERYFEIRRPGEMQLVAVGYRTPSALADDTNALETAVEILSDSPRGRLYKALVETGKAAQVFGWSLSMKDPGFVLFGAVLKKDGDREAVRQILIDTIENGLIKEPATKEEVDTSVVEAITDFERTFSDPEQFAVDLSDYIALGDWRMFFVDRDAMHTITPEAVNAAPSKYFVRDNRVVGVFIPDDEPKRAPELKRFDVKDIIAKATFKSEGDTGEAFDVSQQNIMDRTERLTINGVKVALLPKKTRGQTVNVMMNFDYGNLQSTFGKKALNEIATAMLMQGTKNLSKTDIANRQSALKMQGDIFQFVTTGEHIEDALRLVGEVINNANFPEDKVVTQIERMKEGIRRRADDPATLARDAIATHFNTYPAGDPRNRLTRQDRLDALDKADRDTLYAWYRDMISTETGEIAIIGDFDAEKVKVVLKEVLGMKKGEAKQPFERIFSEYHPVPAKRILIDTPSKENAVLLARMTFPANLFEADAAAYVVADWIMGGGTGLSNRLVDRLRQKEGYSYGVYSALQLPEFGNNAAWMASAIVAPQNLIKAEEAMKEEIARALKDGLTAEELTEAKKGILESRHVNRAQDGYLAYSWMTFMKTNRDFFFSRDFEKAIESVTLDQVNAALHRMIEEDKLVFVLAGDLAKAGVQK